LYGIAFAVIVIARSVRAVERVIEDDNSVASVW